MQQTSNRSENRATMTLNENPTVEHHLIASLIRTIHRMILKHQMISWGTWTLVGASAGPERGNQWGLTFMSRAKAPKIDNNFKAISGKIPRGCSWTWVIGSWGNQLYWNQDNMPPNHGMTFWFANSTLSNLELCWTSYRISKTNTPRWMCR